MPSDFNTFASVFYVGMFVLPGFIVKSILNAAAPAKKRARHGIFPVMPLLQPNQLCGVELGILCHVQLGN